MNIFKSTGVQCFAVQHDSLDRIRKLGKPKLRQSACKLYLFVCQRTSRGEVEVELDASEVFKHTGLTKNTLSRARTELLRLDLIKAPFQPGQGGTHTYGVVNLKTGKAFDPKTSEGAAYFQVPTVVLFIDALIQDIKASSLVYASLLAEANRLSTPQLNLPPKKLAALSSVTPETLRNVLPLLVGTDPPLLKIIDHKVEILDPYTGGSLTSDPGQKQETFWHLNKEGKRLSVKELLTPGNFIIYYTAEIPDLVPGLAQQDVRCRFHSDSTPSMSVNLEDGTWYCHACEIGGGTLDFEMKKLDTENKAEAWRSICARFGVRFLAKPRGAMTHEHVYRDEDGHPIRRLRRYEDGSGRWYTFIGGKWKLGLGGRKRIPYNLPDVRAAHVVIITEGEKKADLLGYMGLRDQDGNPVAVTCTGSANSWKPELVEYFHNKKVIVFRDSDDPGKRYADAIVGSLKHAGIPCSVVDFEGYGNDVRDFLDSHKRTEELLDHVNSDWLEVPEKESKTVNSDNEI